MHLKCIYLWPPNPFTGIYLIIYEPKKLCTEIVSQKNCTETVTHNATTARKIPKQVEGALVVFRQNKLWSIF